MNLPPLTEKIGPGAPGGHELERLMHQLLLRYGDKHGFVYEPVGGRGGDGGVDGIVRKGGVPGLEGPVGFQFKWLWENVHKGSKARQIEESLQRAQRNEELRHWVLVTPWDLKEDSEKKWLLGLPLREGLTVHHWGQARVEQLFELAPALFARYYPEAARQRIAGYDGFEFKGFVEQYRKRLALAHRKLRTLGLPPETLRERDASREIRLRDVFVPLQLIPSGGEERRPLQEFLERGQSVVVLGDPGTGKTTLLTFLALLHGSGEAELPGFQPSPEVVPILVFLRDFVRLQKDDSRLDILDYVTRRARTDLNLPHAHRAFFEAALAMGEAIVFFDGLDEAGGQVARRRMAGVVRTFRDQYPSCPVWVTSRIYSYTGDIELPEGEFQKTRLASLDDTQVDDFVGRWYWQQLPHNEREREERTTSLREAVRRTPSVRRLAGNPLLLTLMAFIHHGLRRLLQDRGELYEKCVEMLLKTWQEAKHEEESSGHPFEDIRLYAHTQKDYLAHLALYIQEQGHPGGESEGRSIVSRKMALDALTSRHLQRANRTRPDLSVAEAREEMARFIDYIHEQTGLLVDRGGDQLSFIHLSFQEYLVAWIFTCLTANNQLDFFGEHLGDPAWEEILLLRLYIVLRGQGGGGETMFDELIRFVLTKLENGDLDADRSQKGWLMLNRAVRDNLDFSLEDRKTILRSAVVFWLKQPDFESEWYKALEEIQLFAEKARSTLAEVLAETLQAKSPADVVAGLHLAQRLTGIPNTTRTLLRSRPDLSAMLADLVFFIEDSQIVELLAQHSNIFHWLSALKTVDSPNFFLHGVMRSSQSGDAPSTQLKSATLALLWRKIIDDLDSRSKFASSQLGSTSEVLFRQTVCFAVRARFHEVYFPLTSLRVVSAHLGSSSDFENALICPQLAQQALGLQGTDDIGELLEAWLQGLLPRLLASFASAASDQVKTLTENLGSDFVHALASNFSSDFDSGSYRDFACAFINDPSRILVNDLFNAIARNSVDDAARDSVHAFARAFVSDFDSDFVNAFVRAFGREFDIDPDARDWEEQLIAALEKEEQRDKILVSWKLWWIVADFTSFEINKNLTENNFSLLLESPVALPLCMFDFLITVYLAYLYNLGRYLAGTYPDGKFPDQALTDYFNRYPFEVFPVALTWQERAKKLRTHLDGLHGTRGALLLTHAAFASLMTGLSLDSPEWNHLVEHRDRNDVLIEASHLFYQICRFENPEANAERLKQIARESTGEAREVFEAAGLLDQP